MGGTCTTVPVASLSLYKKYICVCEEVLRQSLWAEASNTLSLIETLMNIYIEKCGVPDEHE